MHAARLHNVNVIMISNTLIQGSSKAFNFNLSILFDVHRRNIQVIKKPRISSLDWGILYYYTS